MSRKTIRRSGVLLGLCALVTAGILAASSLAANGNQSANNWGAGASARSGSPAFGPGGVVHSEQIVLDEAGDAYITQTLDSGTVESASPGELTIKEGTKEMPYGTVALKIPAGATVIRDGSEAELGEFEAGDFVLVRHSSDGTYVCGGAAGSGWFGSGNWGPGGGHWGPGNGNWHGWGPSGAGSGGWPQGFFGG